VVTCTISDRKVRAHDEAFLISISSPIRRSIFKELDRQDDRVCADSHFDPSLFGPTHKSIRDFMLDDKECKKEALKSAKMLQSLDDAMLQVYTVLGLHMICLE